jgi:hypothetical protein
MLKIVQSKKHEVIASSLNNTIGGCAFMSENWNYSKMTHAAALSGGPEAYADALKRDGMRVGAARQKEESLIDTIIIGGVSFAGGWLFHFVTSKYQEHKRKIQIELEKAEKDTEVAKKNFIESVQANNENSIVSKPEDHADISENTTKGEE